MAINHYSGRKINIIFRTHTTCRGKKQLYEMWGFHCCEKWLVVFLFVTPFSLADCYQVAEDCLKYPPPPETLITLSVSASKDQTRDNLCRLIRPIAYLKIMQDKYEPKAVWSLAGEIRLYSVWMQPSLSVTFLLTNSTAGLIRSQNPSRYMNIKVVISK